MSAAGLAAVQDHVAATPELADRLAAIGGDDELIVAILDVGSTIGAPVTADDLTGALAAGRRRHIERWV